MMIEKGALIGRGRTAEVYAWGADRILKLYEPHMPGHLVEQEFNLTRAARAAALPVPAAEELVEVDSRRGIVFERVEGPSMLKFLGQRPWKLFACARQLAELHAQIHRCQVFAPEIPALRQATEKAIYAAPDLPPALQEKALACLAQLPERDALCHGDFHPDNILMSGRGPVIIDWMTATRGNPLADVCRTALLFETSGLPPGSPPHVKALLNLLRSLIEAAYIRRYTQVHSATRQEIFAWQLPLMAARLREVEAYPAEKRAILKRMSTI